MNCKWVSSQDENIKCKRHADSSGYCIFHKKNKSKRERILFNSYIKKGQISDFSGFYFEEELNINKTLNYDYNKLKFYETIFCNDVKFNKFIFNNTVDFTKTEFKGKVDFTESTFLKNCIFSETKFNEKYINEQIFQRTNVNGQKLIVEKCINFPRLDGILFSPYTKFILKDINYKKEDAICGRNNYRIARVQAKQTEDNENIGYYYYNERNYASEFLKSNKYKGYKEYLSNDFFDFLSKYTIGYGEKPLRLLFISFFIISVFALIYMFIGLNTIDYGLIKLNLVSNTYSFYEFLKMYLEAWYFSMITFSTVGYGDIIAFGLIGKIIACIEVFLGITLHATWTSILLSRLVK